MVEHGKKKKKIYEIGVSSSISSYLLIVCQILLIIDRQAV